MPEWKDRKVLVLGLGDSGLSMTRWLARQGAKVSVADTRTDPPHLRALSEELPNVPIATGAFRKRDFSSAEAIAISPGLDRREALITDAIRRGVPVVGDIELFAQGIERMVRGRPMPRPKVLAITGSNGKSTVTAMAGEASRASGRNTVVAGNIGLPVLDALVDIEDGGRTPDVFVLELSSFQLESTAHLNADAATVLNVTEDHLDRYESMADYAAAKSRIFEGDGVQVLNRLDAWSMSMARAGRRIADFGRDPPPGDRSWGIADDAMLARGRETLMRVDELKVAGTHNAVNALAALALGDAVGLPLPSMLEGLRGFAGLPHRLAKVADLHGVSFYDDSKGTNVGATVAALNGMTVPVVLIAGGDGKGQDFSPLAATVAGRARAVVLIGRDARRIEAALTGTGVPVLSARSLEDAVASAYAASRPGDAVLLSPACASYDMFRNYVHRAQVFVETVRALCVQEQGAAP